MARYIRKLKRLGSLGPSEERGAGLWVGYDIAGIDEDLSNAGLVRVEEWSGEQLASYGVTTFLRVGEDDHVTREKLLGTASAPMTSERESSAPESGPPGRRKI